MPTVAQARVFNAAFKPSYFPVAVFVGGTAGIGQAMVEAFARYTNGNAHIIIVGRNQAAAEAIIAKLPKPAASVDNDEHKWKHEFIPCDVTLMKNVHGLTTDLRTRLDRINFLVLSAGLFSFNGFEPTSEGIDSKMAGRYYSRWLLTRELTPLVKHANELGQDGKVMSVLGAGQSSALDKDDLGLKKNFSGMKAMMQTITYTDFGFEEFAIREPTVSFNHIFPGMVNTDSMKYDTWGMKLARPFLAPLVKLMSISPADCAETMWYALFNAKEGFTRWTAKAEIIEDKSWKGTDGDETRKKIWEHSVEATSVGQDT